MISQSWWKMYLWHENTNIWVSKCIQHSNPLHLHTYCTLLRSKSRQYMQGWCARLLFPLAMATNRDIINIQTHLSFRIWWYKTSKLLFTVVFPYLHSFQKPGCKHSLPPLTGLLALIFVFVKWSWCSNPWRTAQPLFSAQLLIKIRIKEGWTSRSRLGEEGVPAVFS